MTYVLVPSTGELADVFTDLVQHLEGAKVVPLSGSLAEQITQCTKFLEKHELRRDVIFITRGTGAFVAQAVTAHQSQRVAVCPFGWHSLWSFSGCLNSWAWA